MKNTINALDIDRRTRKSQRFFNPLLLSIYDFFLFNFISPYLWGCKEALLVNWYRSLCGTKHLEVGVGTGHLLDKSSPAIHRLSLMDLSVSCLDKTSKRLKRYNPNTWHKNILLPLNDVEDRFDSISINYVMHCVAGTYKTKGVSFGYLKNLLTDDGVLFGASVLRTDDSGRAARILMNLLNWTGVFNNNGDTIQDLQESLQRHFRFSKVIKRSSSALFIATDCESSFRSIEEKHYGIS